MMYRIGILACLTGLGCATARSPWSRDDRASGPQGSVVVRPGADRAVSAGPGLLHLFSKRGGARVYRAAARSRGDADCVGDHTRAPAPGRAPTLVPIAIEPDRETGLTLAAAEVACVSVAAGEVELFWHVHSEVQVLAPSLASVASRFGP